MGTVSYMQSFAAELYSAAKPKVEESADGTYWVVSLPIPVMAQFRIGYREVVAGRINMRGFLRDFASRADAAIKAAVQQYKDGAETARLRERVRVLEDERSE